MQNHIKEVFNGNKVSPAPVSIRFDLWLEHARNNALEPEVLHGLSYEEAEDYLGFRRTARFRSAPKLDFGNFNPKIVEDPEKITEHYKCAGRTLRRVTHCGDSGLKGHITEYPIKDAEDCQVFLKMLEAARITNDNTGLLEMIEDTADKGWVAYIINSCPAHKIMLDWIGYENFFYLNYDIPELIAQLIRSLELLYRRDLWPVAKNSPTGLIIHGNHFSGAMTPKPLFMQYFMPYFVEFNALMHSVGKKVIFHSDADLGELMSEIPAAGFDGADCLATEPLVTASMEDYIQCWGDKLVYWGGLPSVLFDKSYLFNDFKEYVKQLRKLSEIQKGIIIGASDNVMPCGEWRRLEYISEVFECRN
jgi:hypothetical protein